MLRNQHDTNGIDDSPRGSDLAGEHLFSIEARRVTICCHNPDTITFKEYRRLGVCITQDLERTAVALSSVCFFVYL